MCALAEKITSRNWIIEKRTNGNRNEDENNKIKFMVKKEYLILCHNLTAKRKMNSQKVKIKNLLKKKSDTKIKFWNLQKDLKVGAVQTTL